MLVPKKILGLKSGTAAAAAAAAAAAEAEAAQQQQPSLGQQQERQQQQQQQQQPPHLGPHVKRLAELYMSNEKNPLVLWDI